LVAYFHVGNVAALNVEANTLGQTFVYVFAALKKNGCALNAYYFACFLVGEILNPLFADFFG
jgi:hypothetical protein